MSEDFPRVAVAILNWNGQHFLEKYLPSVVRNGYPNQVVYVIDNDSTDGSIEFLKKTHPSVKLVQLDKNYGFAEGYNRGLAHITADYLAILNSDAEPSEGWLRPLVSLLESNEKIGAAQPKLIADHDRTAFEYAGAAGGLMDAFGYPFARGRVFQSTEKDQGQFEEPCPIFWATGAALFIRQSLFEELGGFDGDFFAHMEEIDLCWRLQNQGYQVYYCPDSTVYHLGGGSLPKSNPRKAYLNFRNSLVAMQKNLPLSEAIRMILIRLVLDAVAGAKELASFKFGHLLAIIRAHWHFFLHQPRWIKKRKAIAYKRDFRSLDGVIDTSIVWNYFVKGRKISSEYPGVRSSK